MNDKQVPSQDLPRATMVVLMLAAFTVSTGYGVVLPLLPYLIERLQGAGVTVSDVSRHTGLLTAVYTLSPFLFAPLWGRLADRHGPRGVLLIGLVGFAVTMMMFAFVESLAAIYAGRFLCGIFAAAVTPVAASVIGNLSQTEQRRIRRFTFVSMAGITGFLLGPMLGVIVTGAGANVSTVTLPAGSVAFPLAATALLALLGAVFAAFAMQGSNGHDRLPNARFLAANRLTWLMPKLLVLTFIVSASVGVFEVGLALRGTQELGLTPTQVALMFTECSLVMFVVQAIVFAPWFNPSITRWLIAPALALLAIGLFLVPRASDFTLMLAVVGVVAASAGILLPILTYWISANAGNAQGWELGKQTAAASLGVTIGSAAGGLLFNVATLPGASFILTAGLAASGLLLTVGLPRLLIRSSSFQRLTPA